MRIVYFGVLLTLLTSIQLAAQDLQAPRRVELSVARQDWQEAQQIIDQFIDAFPSNPNELQLVAKYELDKWIPLVRKNIQEESSLYQRVLNERNQMIAQTYLDRYPYGPHRQSVSWILATSLNTLNGYQTFISKFPTSEEAKLARQRILEADRNAFETAKQQFTSNSFSQYLQNFPQGNFVREANAFKLDALENESYATAEATQTVSGWQQFLANFPSGKRIVEANASLEFAYFQTGERGYQRKNWAEAITGYQTYLQSYPNGKYREEVQRKLSAAKLRQKSSPQPFTYLAYERDPMNAIGISIGGLAVKGSRAYFKLKSNRELLSRGGLFYTVDEDGYLNFDGSVQYTGDVQENQWAAILGGNFAVFHPIHIYMGVGIQNEAAYFEADRISSDGNFKGTSWIKYTGEQNYRFIAEAGGVVNVANYGIVRLGLNYVNSQIQFQWGLGFRIGK
ncbi:MAG: tetratricopeptide repeat protein [Spirosomataceae bacterium]